MSNVLQRDNVLFAGRLHACLADVATANEKEVTFLKISRDFIISPRLKMKNSGL